MPKVLFAMLTMVLVGCGAMVVSPDAPEPTSDAAVAADAPVTEVATEQLEGGTDARADEGSADAEVVPQSVYTGLFGTRERYLTGPSTCVREAGGRLRFELSTATGERLLGDVTEGVESWEGGEVQAQFTGTGSTETFAVGTSCHVQIRHIDMRTSYYFQCDDSEGRRVMAGGLFLEGCR